MDEMVFGRRYRVTEKIGSGGMAEVYKAVDEVLGRTVAVKVLHPRYAGDPSYAARFRQEAQAAANISSPNIVNMYDWGQDGDTYYIVMEYVRGRDLKDIIVENGPLDSRKVADIGAQVASALSAAHGYDVIHRDIKPQNIMVQPDGSVKVMDFGIARAGGTTMTQTGSVLGHRALRLARAGPGHRAHPGERPVLARRRALRGGDRATAVRRRHPRRRRAQAGQRHPRAAACGEPLDQPRPRDDHPQGDGQATGRPLRDRRRDALGPAGGGRGTHPGHRCGRRRRGSRLRRLPARQRRPYADQTAVMPQVGAGTGSACREHALGAATRRSGVDRRGRGCCSRSCFSAGLAYGAYRLGVFNPTVSVPDVTNQTAAAGDHDPRRRRA